MISVVQTQIVPKHSREIDEFLDIIVGSKNA